jgi:hypothetical protein
VADTVGFLRAFVVLGRQPRDLAAAAMFTSASNPNTSILPRIKSETRGWVTPKSLTICA